MSAEEVAQFNRAQGDPSGGDFDLEAAFAGDATLRNRKAGNLVAVMRTTMGDIECRLFETQAPRTVANFVGLARGVRPFFDRQTGAWVTRQFYDGVEFHRVIADFMIQAGDPSANGTGDAGYVLVDEFAEGLSHDAHGVLSMGNIGPNTGSSQFFITLAPVPHLDGKHAIFGRCDHKIPARIGEVDVDPRHNHRPRVPVRIEDIRVTRKRR